jgi:hypothetical protein
LRDVLLERQEMDRTIPIASCFTRLLVLWLCISLGLPGPGLVGGGTAYATPPEAHNGSDVMQVLERVETGSQAVTTELQAIFLHARSPNTLSAGPTDFAALRARLTRLETRFLALKGDIESSLSVGAVLFQNPADDLDRKLAVMNHYFALLSELTQARALLSLPTAEAWSGEFNLQVPVRTLSDLAGFTPIEGFDRTAELRALLQDPNSTIVLAEGGTPELVWLRLNPKLVQNFVMVARVNTPTPAGAVEALKYLAAASFLEDYVQLNALRPTPSRSAPEFGRYAGQLEPLRHAAERMSQDQRLHQEASFRAGLVATLAQAAPNRRFVTPDLLRELAPSCTFDRSAPIEELAAEEERNQNEAATQLLEAWPTALTELAPADRDRVLASILARSRYDAVRPRIGQSIRFEPAALEAAAAALERRFDTLSATISPADVDLWVAAAQAQTSRFHAGVRQAFVAELRDESLALARKTGVPDAQLIVEMKPLARALEREFEVRGYSRRTLSWLGPVFQSDSYAQARHAHAAVVAQLAKELTGAAPALAGTDGRLNQARLNAFLDRYAPATRPSGAVARAVQGLRDRFRGSRIGTAPKALTGATALLAQELREVADAGAVAGFYVAAIGETPTLAQLPWNQTQRDWYREVLKGLTLSRSLLAEKLKSGRALHVELAATREVARAQGMVDEAIELHLANVRESLEAIARARGLEGALRELIKSTTLSSLMGEAFPALSAQYAQLINQLLEPSTVSRIWHQTTEAYTKPMLYMMPLFAMQIASLFFRPTRPFVRWIDALQTSLTPVTSAYMATTMPLIATDLIGAEARTRRARTDARDAETFFSTSVTTEGLFDYFDVLEARDGAQLARAARNSSLLSTALFMGVPGLAKSGRRLLYRVADAQALERFRTLGLTGDAVSWNEATIRQAAQARRFDYEAQLASRYLLSRIRSQRARLALMYRDFAPEFRALDLVGQDRTFNLERLDEALDARRAAMEQGVLSAADFEKAAAAQHRLAAYVASEWEFAAPGPLAQMAYGARSRLNRWAGRPAPAAWMGRPSPTAPQLSYVRASLYVEVRGYALPFGKGGGEASAARVDASQDFYAVLQVERDASADQIKKAYRGLAKRYHPDHNQGSPKSTERFKELGAAYAVLSDPAQRTAYDRARGYR